MKRIILSSLLIIGSLAYAAVYKQTWKQQYDTATGQSTFTAVARFEVGTSTRPQDQGVVLLGTGSITANEISANYLNSPSIQIGGGTTGNIYQTFTSSPSWGWFYPAYLMGTSSAAGNYISNKNGNGQYLTLTKNLFVGKTTAIGADNYVSIGTTIPVPYGGLLSVGTAGTGDNVGIGADYASAPIFWWYPKYAALRFGAFGNGIGGEWDIGNIGLYSVAGGNSCLAPGLSAVAFGNRAHAHGNYSYSWGWDADATGASSLTQGFDTAATADYAFMIGTGNGESDKVTNSTARSILLSPKAEYSYPGDLQGGIHITTDAVNLFGNVFVSTGDYWEQKGTVANTRILSTGSIEVKEITVLGKSLFNNNATIIGQGIFKGTSGNSAIVLVPNGTQGRVKVYDDGTERLTFEATPSGSGGVFYIDGTKKAVSTFTTTTDGLPKIESHTLVVSSIVASLFVGNGSQLTGIISTACAAADAIALGVQTSTGFIPFGFDGTLWWQDTSTGTGYGFVCGSSITITEIQFSLDTAPSALSYISICNQNGTVIGSSLTFNASTAYTNIISSPQAVAKSSKIIVHSQAQSGSGLKGYAKYWKVVGQ